MVQETRVSTESAWYYKLVDASYSWYRLVITLTRNICGNQVTMNANLSPLI